MISGVSNPRHLHERTHFYKYVTSSTAKIILTNGTLRWSSPLIFNDLFDVYREVAPDVKAVSLSSALASSLLTGVESSGMLGEMTDRERSAFRSMFYDQMRHTPAELERMELTLDSLRRHWRDELPSMRILSLCEQPDIPTMWAHYTDQHRGVVLRFECSDYHDSPWLLARPVRYTEELPSFATVEGFNSRLLDGPRTLFDDYCYQKTSDWSYEREWRILCWARRGEQGTHSDWGFAPASLSEAIFGSRASDEDVRDITTLMCHDLGHLRAFRSRPDTANKLQFDEITNNKG